MAIYSTSHAQSAARDLADRLSLRFKNGAGFNTVRQANDANGWPLIFVSANANEAEAQPVALIRLKNIDPGCVDVFGNSTLPFTPHDAQVAFELTAAGAPIPSSAIGYSFTVTSAAATAGATYTNNGATFTVQSTIAGSTTFSGYSTTGAPAASGTLTKATGTGDSTIAFSANSVARAYAYDWATVVVETAKMNMVFQEFAIPSGTAVTEASLNTAITTGPNLTLADIDWNVQGNT